MKYNILYLKYKCEYYIHIIFKKIIKALNTIENRIDIVRILNNIRKYDIYFIYFYNKNLNNFFWMLKTEIR